MRLKAADRKTAAIAALLISKLVLIQIFQAPPATAQEDRARPSEVVAKVHEAVALIEADAAAGLQRLRDPESQFRWKDTYVFAVDCLSDRVLANAAFPERVGGDIKQHTDYAGKQYGLELCDVAMQPGGGWLEYVWLPPGGDQPQRKVSFVMSTAGAPNIQVGAGVYDDTLSLQALRAVSRSTMDQSAREPVTPGDNDGLH